jgi:hypothetical protein
MSGREDAAVGCEGLQKRAVYLAEESLGGEETLQKLDKFDRYTLQRKHQQQPGILLLNDNLHRQQSNQRSACTVNQ